MIHRQYYLGAFDENFLLVLHHREQGLSPKTYRRVCGDRSMSEWPNDTGYVFGYLERSGGNWAQHVARAEIVSVNDCIVRVPVLALPRLHSDHKYISAGGTTFGDMSASNLLFDLLYRNRDEEPKLWPLLAALVPPARHAAIRVQLGL